MTKLENPKIRHSIPSTASTEVSAEHRSDNPAPRVRIDSPACLGPGAPVSPESAGLCTGRRTSELEKAGQVVSTLLDRLCADRLLPELVTSFLDRHWRPYLMWLHLVHGDDRRRCAAVVAMTEELIWSLQPKSDAASRKRLYGLLPRLYKGLHAGLEVAGVGVSEQDDFFADLARLHAGSLSPSKSPIAGSAADAANPFARRSSPAERRRDDSARGAESAEAVGPPPARPGTKPAPPEARTETKPISKLRIGTWLEFSNERAEKRVLRLKWISKQGSVFFFHDHHRGIPICVTAERISERLRDGSASIVGSVRA